MRFRIDLCLPSIAACLGIGLSSPAMAQTPLREEPATVIGGILKDNQSIFIDGDSFKITPGQAKGDATNQIKMLGARDLGPGAIIFRAGKSLYIVGAPLDLQDAGSGNSKSVAVVAEKAQPNRIRFEYVLPKNPEHQKLYDLLKEKRALETVQQIFSPFRLPIDLTIKTIGCDGVVNAWYDREDSRPTVTICYEYLQNILQSLPKDTTPSGFTTTDATVGQFFWIISHEVGHAMFDIYNVPIFGREEDAADFFAGYIMLQFGKEPARRLVGGAAWAYKTYIKDYRQNPKVQIQLAGFSSNHGQPEERFYDLMCMAYGADPVLFADVTADGWLPPTRAPSCKYEFRTLTRAFRQEISPHIDQQLARQVLDTSWLPRSTVAERE
jgi:hypothetical protein